MDARPVRLGAAGARRTISDSSEDCLSAQRARVPQRRNCSSTAGSRNTGRISAKPQAHTVLATFDKTKVARRSQRRKLTPRMARQPQKTHHPKQSPKTAAKSGDKPTSVDQQKTPTQLSPRWGCISPSTAHYNAISPPSARRTTTVLDRGRAPPPSGKLLTVESPLPGCWMLTNIVR